MPPVSRSSGKLSGSPSRALDASGGRRHGGAAGKPSVGAANQGWSLCLLLEDPTPKTFYRERGAVRAFDAPDTIRVGIAAVSVAG